MLPRFSFELERISCILYAWKKEWVATILKERTWWNIYPERKGILIRKDCKGSQSSKISNLEWGQSKQHSTSIQSSKSLTQSICQETECKIPRKEDRWTSRSPSICRQLSSCWSITWGYFRETQIQTRKRVTVRFKRKHIQIHQKPIWKKDRSQAQAKEKNRKKEEKQGHSRWSYVHRQTTQTYQWQKAIRWCRVWLHCFGKRWKWNTSGSNWPKTPYLISWTHLWSQHSCGTWCSSANQTEISRMEDGYDRQRHTLCPTQRVGARTGYQDILLSPISLLGERNGRER